MCKHLNETIRYLTEQAELAMTRAKELQMLAPNRLAFDTTLKQLTEAAEETYLGLYRLNKETSTSSEKSSGSKSETASSTEIETASDGSS